MRRVFAVLGLILGAYLVVRAALEPFTIDFDDPSTYRNDWGGPSLAGVLTVHSGPGVVILIILAVTLARRQRARRRTSPVSGGSGAML